ncbi:hypothetical protein [Sphingomonas sp. 28-63-12]|uniref:hypothetical protein n=1 Tax=Sphingomonas sp. 28-63-12 TaxID=1970434 RepID=UPI000BD49B73|nr:MAG: hypothetical protein B7Y47_14285 [Sphingomonas sp. 28-63-12]
MPWKMLHSWYATLRRGQADPPMPLTLVTLRGMEDSTQDEIAFYAEAEFEALVDWAANGCFVMAFVARERDELTLLCTESVETMQMRVRELPLVVAGLAHADIRTVATVRLASPVASSH